MSAKVEALFRATGEDFVGVPAGSLTLTLLGIQDDRHNGPARPADARTPWHPRGVEIANTRQVSIVSVEECAEIARRLDLPAVDPALLGANFVLAGLAELTQLPPASRLLFPSGATIFVTEPNAPCRYPGRKLAAAFERPELEFAFPREAVGLRGLVGIVERAGEVRAGDGVRVVRAP